jgi:DNA-binding NarL/FixJ family response regulator
VDKCETIRVLLSEDHDLIRCGLRYILHQDHQLELVGEATSFLQTLALQKQQAPDVILLDLTLDDGAVLERIPELLAPENACKVLVITADPNQDTHLRAFQLGAMGVCTKCASSVLLLKAIRVVAAGQIWIDHQTTAAFIHRSRVLESASKELDLPFLLTPRQRDIARQAAQGYPAKTIGKNLNISDKTVRNQLSVIYSILNVSGQIDLALKAQQLGLL